MKSLAFSIKLVLKYWLDMKAKKQGFWRRYKKILVPLIILLGGVIAFQVFYPSGKMLPIAKVDGLDVGGKNVQDVVDELNNKYNNLTRINIYFGKNTKPHDIVELDTLGITVGNADRINSMRYPWYMRLVPSSILWYGLLEPSADPTIKQNTIMLNDYIIENLGDSCSVKPVDASLYLNEGRFRLIDAMSGGTCAMSDVKTALSDIDFSDIDKVEVRIAMDEINPDVTNDDARELSTILNTKLLRDIELSNELGGMITIPSDVVKKWIEFEIVDKKLTIRISDTGSTDYYNKEVAPKVTSEAGVTVITTSNLTDTIHSQGSDGKVLNIAETNRRILEYLTDKRQSASIALSTIFPGIEYTSQFDSSSVGIEALIKYYAETHNGSYGVRLTELTGQMRTASYNAHQVFNVAGAGRMIMGYSMLGRIEQGLPASRDGTNEDQCIQNVLVNYSTDCVHMAVYGNLSSEARSLGLQNTSVFDRQVRSNADDLAVFLEKLYHRRLGLWQTNNQTLYGLLQQSKPRNGIAGAIGINDVNATGTANGGGILSDAAIVFTADSSYVLVILADGGTWQNISELTNQIQGLISKR